MRIVYFGTPDFSVKPLQSLLKTEGIEIIAVVCNKDKPVGRKQILTPPPVKVYALDNGLKVLQYSKIRAEGVSDLKELNPDMFITCAFGQILSQEILDIPKFGTFNIHASLLPKYRGASPINYAILNGENKTGITIMKTDIGIDTGDIVMQSETDIKPDETAGELFSRLSDLGAKLITDFICNFPNVNYIKQDESKATFTKMIKKEDAILNFNDTAENVVNKVRAFNPSPVAFTFFNGEPFKVFKAEISELTGAVGEVVKNDFELVIGCLQKSVKLTVVQKAGGKQLSATDFLRGNKIPLGYKFTK